MVSNAAPVVLITGANQGLGFSMAQLLSQSQATYDILLGCRTLSKGEQAVLKLASSDPNPKTKITALQIDITSWESINAAVQKVSALYGVLDILVNNAAVGSDSPSQVTCNVEAWQPVFQTNVVGTAIVTEAFRPLLQKSHDGKLIVLSSSMGSITMAEAFPPSPLISTASPYRASKAAISMMVVEWAKTWKGDGVRVWGIDPGLCATDFAGEYSRSKGRDPREGAKIVLDCVEGKRDQDVGKICWEQGGESGVRPW